MITRIRYSLFVAVLVALVSHSAQLSASDTAKGIESKLSFKEQEAAIYTHMKRYGINREDIKAIRRLYETSPPHSYPHVGIAAERVLTPGEHFRIEMDEFIVTMKIPDALPIPGNRLSPYNNTRNPDPAMQKELNQLRGALKVADMAWQMCGSVAHLLGCYETAGVTIWYYILTPGDHEKRSTPEKMSKTHSDVQKAQVPSAGDIAQATRENLIDNRTGNRIVHTPESVVVNGRIWVRRAMDDLQNRTYLYTTLLAPDRMLGASFGVPYSSKAKPTAPTYPPPLEKAMEQMEEMFSSLRVVKTNDDGSPDPFVVERVEPGPLPVREKRPAAD